MPSSFAIVVGSLRRKSFNRRLARALTVVPSAEAHDFRFVEIADLPLYNQDQDGDQSAEARRMKAEILASDGVIFVTPEYNRSIPGVLKNAIDHGSRPYGESAWRRKPAGIIGASPGALGTAMAQQHLRNVLAALDMPTLSGPELFHVWKDELVDADGKATGTLAVRLEAWLAAFIAHVERHWR